MSRKLTNTLCFPALSLGLALMLAAAVAQADPLPLRDVLKFSQLPMDGTPIFGDDGTVHRVYGHDELSTAYSSVDAVGLPTPYVGQFMADDFADRFNSPVVHVKWWGSYLDNYLDPALPVDKFLISFETDVPAGPAPSFSHPGVPMLNQIVNRGSLSVGSGTFTETMISPGGDPLNEHLFEYNAELHLGKEFFQKPDTVYWLKIVALVDLPAGVDPANDPVTRWGWHNRDYTVPDPLASVAPQVSPGEDIVGYVGPPTVPTPVWHFQDDAVTGNVVIDTLATPDGYISPLVNQDAYQPTRYIGLVDGPPNIGNFSKDLAFQLYTTVVPEPASIGLASCGMVFLTVCALRRRRSDLRVGHADAQEARQRRRQVRAARTVTFAALLLTVCWTTRVEASNIITNGGFELPANPNTTVGQVIESLVPGWETTASDDNIEIWSNGYAGVYAAEGYQHAELNATEVSTLYQDVPGIAANSTVGYSFAHRGRLGVDTLRLTISDLGIDNLGGGVGPAADTVLFAQLFSTGNSAWVQYSAGNISNTTLGNDMRFAFESVTAAGGNQAIGNFLDNVQFGVDVGIRVPEPVAAVLAGIGSVGALCLVRRRLR